MEYNNDRKRPSASREATVASVILLQLGSNKKRKRLWLSLGAAAASALFMPRQKGSMKKWKHNPVRATHLKRDNGKRSNLQISRMSLQGVQKAKLQIPKAAGMSWQVPNLPCHAQPQTAALPRSFSCCLHFLFHISEESSLNCRAWCMQQGQTW